MEDCMLTHSELFPQLPPNIQGKPFLPFQLSLPSGTLLQVSEPLAVLLLKDIHLNTTRCWVLLRKASGSSSHPLPLAWERVECRGTWPCLWPTVFLDFLNLKHVTAWMTGSVLNLLSPGYGLHSWKAFIEIMPLCKKVFNLSLDLQHH